MTKKPKVMITQRGALQRINRALAPNQILKRARPGPATQEHGQFYVVDFKRNFLAQRDVNIEDFARELGVIQPWESVSDE
jgi:hypothetical protein